ncbi:MAG: metallophosphoesterase [Verrucomicrobiia bacterium]
MHTLVFSRTAAILALVVAAFLAPSRADGIERVWLTPTSSSPLRVTVSWETDEPGNSLVEFGATRDLGLRVASERPVRLHHVEITVQPNAPCYYRVRTGDRASAIASFQPEGETRLRIVVVANLANLNSTWGEAVLRERPNLLLTAGDNVPQLHDGGPVDPTTTATYSRLIARFPALFRSTLFLPALGNHDKEIGRRGSSPPQTPVYDIEATAFKAFFPLPDGGWKWHYDVPEFGLRLVALDLHHLSDVGTTWQTSHPFDADSEQFNWYRDTVAKSTQPFLITIYNEQHAAVRRLNGGEWWRSISRGSMAITGFGHFGERGEMHGFPYFNTSVRGTGDRYPDPQSRFLASEDNFLLLTLAKGGHFDAELRNLQGHTLDSIQVGPQQTR